MVQVPVVLKNGEYELVPVYNIYDFPYSDLNHKAIKCKHKKWSYAQCFAAFDIETTTIEPLEYKNRNPNKPYHGTPPYGFMYIWQMCVGGICITGRTWEEFTRFCEILVDELSISKERRLVIAVHNLPYEFQFMRDFIDRDLGGFTVFATARRKPIYVLCENGIEFRCTYRLTNMTLAKAVENEKGTKHPKALGDLDYRQIRTCNTYLEPEELGYCISDVLGLYELYECKMVNEFDNLESIPLTSTGYVRRDCRNSCRKDRRYRDRVFLKNRMTPNVYRLLIEEGRGGNTHANRYLANRIIYDGDSYDEISGYPACMFLYDYPSGQFTPYGEIESYAEFEKLETEGYAMLFRIHLLNVRLKDEITVPYIPVSKCLKRSAKSVMDNGRILTSDYLYLTVNDIDFKIIRSQYEYDGIQFDNMHIAKYSKLPEALLAQVKHYFVLKCELKEQIQALEDKEEITAEELQKLEDLNYLYAKSKNRLNGIFGMCYTNPVHAEISINEDGEWIEIQPDIEEALNKFYRSRNNFLTYAWGPWVTSWNRYHLQQLLDVCGAGVAYTDTDSAKGVNFPHDQIELMNEELKKRCEERGAYCDVNGKRFYMGLYDKENKKPIKRFKTLGAKKYAYEDEKGFHITVSGVNKKLGAKEMQSVDNFKVGFTFREAGGLTLYYNDESIHQITVNGDTFTTGSNIGMVDSTYTLGVTEEYADLIGLDINTELLGLNEEIVEDVR